MRDDDFWHYLNLAFIALVAGVVVAVFVKGFKEPLQPGGGGQTAPVPAAASPAEQVCGQVVGTCEVKYELKTSSCRPAAAKKELMQNLTDPIEAPECQKEEERVSRDCAAGCRFDYGSLISIPGKLNFEFTPEKDESGMCYIQAKRTVTMRGICIQGPEDNK